MKASSIWAWLWAILFALAFHAAVVLFGGIFFLDKKQDHSTLQQVELLKDDDDAAKKKKDEKQETPTEKKEEIQADTEKPPDATEIMRNLELSAVADAPALEAASLSEIEQALNGGKASGDFADALTLSSGGRIGGTGTAGALDEKLDDAFNLSEIDQKPRAIFQASPLYPAEMRGKKVEGSVTVIFVVDSSGKVQSPRIDKSNYSAFERPALDAVKQWKFEPAVKAGQRVSCKMRVPIRFQPN
jgi:periplasmic protein TonB